MWLQSNSTVNKIPIHPSICTFNDCDQTWWITWWGMCCCSGSSFSCAWCQHACSHLPYEKRCRRNYCNNANEAVVFLYAGGSCGHIIGCLQCKCEVIVLHQQLPTVLKSLLSQLSWTLAMSCQLVPCLREPSSAAWRRSPVTEASWLVLQETTPQSFPTTLRPRSPESSCLPAPRK